MLLLCVLQDLARASSVQGETGAIDAVRHALHAFRGRWARALGAWLLSALSSLLVVGLAAFVVGHLHVERRAEERILAVFLVHQAAAFAVAVCRAGWLAQSLRLVLSEPLPELTAEE
jgi:hypothetical protein